MDSRVAAARATRAAIEMMMSVCPQIAGSSELGRAASAFRMALIDAAQIAAWRKEVEDGSGNNGDESKAGTGNFSCGVDRGGQE